MWVLPSLGRPDSVSRLVSHMPDAPITLVVYEGDPLLERYLDLQPPTAWSIIQIPNFRDSVPRLGQALNYLFVTNPLEEFYGFIADDCLPEPADWYTQLSDAAGQWGISYGDDGIHGEALCTHPCVGGQLVREVGFWCMPGVAHSYFDTFWMNVGKKTGLMKYLPEVKMNHRHPYNGKAEMDETYRRGQEMFEADKNAYFARIQSNWFEETIRNVSDSACKQWPVETRDVVRL